VHEFRIFSEVLRQRFLLPPGFRLLESLQKHGIVAAPVIRFRAALIDAAGWRSGSHPLPPGCSHPISYRRDQRVHAGHITPSEAAEIGKVIDTYVRAYQTAELNDRTAPLNQMSDEQLMHIIRSGESTTPRLLTVDSG
jgi:hypothetical protein